MATAIEPARPQPQKQSKMFGGQQSLPEHTGVFDREVWRPARSEIEAGNYFVIGKLADGTSVKGYAKPGELISGLTYRFFGPKKENDKYGPEIAFQAFSKSEPHSRFGLVNYLARYAPGIGPGLAAKLFDAFGSDACKILRTDPERAAATIPRLTLGVAREAAEALQKISALEDTKIELTNLFAGRGFPAAMLDQCISRLGPLAPERIKRDPFCMLVYGFSGAGFARCKRLYDDLGLPSGRLKVQMLCIWHAIREDRGGNTWIPASQLSAILGQTISGVKVDIQKAVTLGRRSGWLAVMKDSNGTWWIADGEAAAAERELAEKLVELAVGPLVLPRFTEAIEGECDGTEGMPVSENEDDFNTDSYWAFEKLLQIGVKTGICQRCGRALTHPISKRVGVGPVCAEAWGVEWIDPDEQASAGEPTQESIEESESIPETNESESE